MKKIKLGTPFFACLFVAECLTERFVGLGGR